jgi:hypothetical protein
MDGCVGLGQKQMRDPKLPAAEPADAIEALAEFLPVATQIEHLLSGATNGRALLEALYDETLDEPVPAHLSALLRG